MCSQEGTADVCVCVVRRVQEMSVCSQEGTGDVCVVRRVQKMCVCV